MRMKILTTATLVILASPAFADFFLVQDNNTKTCSIVDQRPTDTNKTMVGPMYKTQAEAENAMRNSVVCRASTTGSGTSAPGTAPPAPPAPPR